MYENRALMCQPSLEAGMEFGLKRVHLRSAFSALCMAKALVCWCSD